MANLTIALKKLYQLEFENNPTKFLHHNAGEEGYTLGGVYQKANPTTISWELVEAIADKYPDIKQASSVAFENTLLQMQVHNVFKNNYWIPLQLDKINSQKIADRMFKFGVVAGIKNGAKLAQKLMFFDYNQGLMIQMYFQLKAHNMYYN